MREAIALKLDLKVNKKTKVENRVFLEINFYWVKFYLAYACVDEWLWVPNDFDSFFYNASLFLSGIAIINEEM